MSWRPNTAMDNAEKNQQILKNLAKLEANKVCADCKRNKHPRWVSWNLGIFICISCSGIHRGMGTHISRVKSIDLDTWPDEHLQNMLRWGNARANKYWESKLSPGHVPSESKIRNFIRTKYESKRWVMDGPMPNPSTLDVTEDDEVPLSLVKQKVTSKSTKPQGQGVLQNSVGIIGNQVPVAQSSSNTTTAESKVLQRSAIPASNSLLGSNFLSSGQIHPSAPISSVADPRPDLKQSILSLYAGKPSSSSHRCAPSGSFSSLQSSTQPSGGGLSDAFSSLDIKASPSRNQSSISWGPWFGNPDDSFSASAPVVESKVASGSGTAGGGAGLSLDKVSPMESLSSLSSAQQFETHKPKTSNDISIATLPPVSPIDSSARFSSNLNLSTPVMVQQKPDPEPASTSMSSAFHSSIGIDPWQTSDMLESSSSILTPIPTTAAMTNSAAISNTSNTLKKPESPIALPSISLSDSFGGWNGWNESKTTAADAGAGTATTKIPPVPNTNMLNNDDFVGWRGASSTTIKEVVGSGDRPGNAIGKEIKTPCEPVDGDLFSNVWK